MFHTKLFEIRRASCSRLTSTNTNICLDIDVYIHFDKNNHIYIYIYASRIWGLGLRCSIASPTTQTFYWLKSHFPKIIVKTFLVYVYNNYNTYKHREITFLELLLKPYIIIYTYTKPHVN